MNAPYSGGCQCGAIRYEIRAEPVTLYVCHCRECQKQSSSAFGMSLTVPRDALVITAGHPKAWQRVAESGRAVAGHFCADCGSRIYHQSATKPGTVNVKPGTLDDTGWLKPVGHVWTGSAQPWVSLPEGGLNHSAQPDDFAPYIERYRRET